MSASDEFFDHSGSVGSHVLVSTGRARRSRRTDRSHAEEERTAPDRHGDAQGAGGVSGRDRAHDEGCGPGAAHPAIVEPAAAFG